MPPLAVDVDSTVSVTINATETGDDEAATTKAGDDEAATAKAGDDEAATAKAGDDEATAAKAGDEGVAAAVVISDGREPTSFETPLEVTIERTGPPMCLAGPSADFFEALGKLS